MDFDESAPEVVAAAIAEELGRPARPPPAVEDIHGVTCTTAGMGELLSEPALARERHSRQGPTGRGTPARRQP